MKTHGDISVEMPRQNPLKGEQWEKEKVAMASSPPRGEKIFPPMAANRISSVQTEFLSSVKKQGVPGAVFLLLQQASLPPGAGSREPAT